MRLYESSEKNLKRPKSRGYTIRLIRVHDHIDVEGERRCPRGSCVKLLLHDLYVYMWHDMWIESEL